MRPITVTRSDRIVPMTEPRAPGAPVRAWRAVIRLLLTSCRRYFARQATISTLVRMNDRILRDIGIERGQIPEIAAQLAESDRDTVTVARFPEKTVSHAEIPVERECA